MGPPIEPIRRDDHSGELTAGDEGQLGPGLILACHHENVGEVDRGRPDFDEQGPGHWFQIGEVVNPESFESLVTVTDQSAHSASLRTPALLL